MERSMELGADEAEDVGEWYENALSKKNIDQDQTAMMKKVDLPDKDLQLAAELGKALLERNRDLESQLIHAQQIDADQQLEIEYLSRQLDTLREATEAKNKIYEEIDKTIQDLEQQNQKLLINSKGDKQKIDRLSDSVQALEEKNEELSAKVEELRTAERERKKMEKQQNKDTRRARSLANLPDSKRNKDIFYERIGNWTYNEGFKNSNLPLNPFEVEIRNLQEVAKNLNSVIQIEKRKRNDLDSENALLWEENTSLEVKIKILEDDLIKYKKLEDDIQRIKLESVKCCLNCGKLTALKRNNLEGELEDDDPKFSSEGRTVKLEGGGSVYGSRESLDQVAMETKETMTSIDSPEDPDLAGISILNELETQYQSLYKKYELLLQKGRRPSSLLLEDEELNKMEEEWEKRLAHKGVQTTLKLHRTGDDVENPHYKVILRDIFATLKKSRIDENVEIPVTSPSEPVDKIGSRSSPVPDAR